MENKCSYEFTKVRARGKKSLSGGLKLLTS